MERHENETDSDEEEKNLKIKKALGKSFQDMIPEIDKNAEEMTAALKKFEQSGYNPFQNLPPVKEKIEFVDREKADPEILKRFEYESAEFESKWQETKEKYGKQVTVNFDNQPDIESQSSIKEAGSYVIRDGKLVPGEAKVREEAAFKNWYSQNADPEDIMRH